MRGAWLSWVLLMAPAAAQGPLPPGDLIDTALTVDIAEPPGRVEPLGPFLTLAVDVTYRYLEVAPEDEATPITLSVVEFPTWSVATVSPTTVFAPGILPPCACEREVVLESYLLVTATQDAPAFTPGRFVVAADAPAHGAYKAAHGEGQVEVEAAYFPLIEAQTASPTRKLPVGQRAEFQVAVTNFGNGPTRAAFSLREAAPGGLAVVLPAPGILEARQRGAQANTGTFGLTVEATAPYDRATLDVLVTGLSVDDPGAKQDTHRVALQLVEPLGPEQAARRLPGPEPVLLLGAVLALGLARRHRDDV